MTEESYSDDDIDDIDTEDLLDLHEEKCGRCVDGFIVTCRHTKCRKQGYCDYGDNVKICPECDGSGFVVGSSDV